jgi:hypothetical protein
MNDPEMTLTWNPVQRYQTCQALLAGRLTTDEAALALGLSQQQVQHLKRCLQGEVPPALRPVPPARNLEHVRGFFSSLRVDAVVGKTYERGSSPER